MVSNQFGGTMQSASVVIIRSPDAAATPVSIAFFLCELIPCSFNVISFTKGNCKVSEAVLSVELSSTTNTSNNFSDNFDR
jgi:hypothetical protein